MNEYNLRCVAGGRSSGFYWSTDKINREGHLRLGTRTYFSRSGYTVGDNDDA